MSNPYICATQTISMHLSQSKSTKCEIFCLNCNFLLTTYHRDSKPAVLDLALLKLKYSPLKQFHCIFPSQNQQNVKFFVWNVIFRNHLSQRLNTYGIGFGIPQTLNMHHSSHFNVVFPVKINKMWNFCLKLWFFLELLIAQTQNM